MTDLQPASASAIETQARQIVWEPSFGRSLLACGLGGAAAFSIVQATYPMFAMTDLPELGISPSPELVKRFTEAQYAFWTSNYSLATAILGLCMGAAVGLVSTKARRVVSGIAGGLAGIAGGAVAGFYCGRLVAGTQIVSADQSLLQSTLVHFSVWAAVFALSVAVVAVIQIRLAAVLEMLIVSLLAALAVAVLYNMSASIFFSNSNLLLLFPETLTERAFWFALASLVLGVGLHLGLKRKMTNPTV